MLLGCIRNRPLNWYERVENDWDSTRYKVDVLCSKQQLKKQEKNELDSQNLYLYLIHRGFKDI